MSIGAPAFRLRAAIMVFAAALVAVISGPAGAANPFEKNVYLTGPRFDSQIPACQEPAALSTIQARFATKEGRFWNSGLRIVEFDRIREVAFRPWAGGTIPRRYCTGRVHTSDGRWRPVRYSIVEDGGLISASWGVEWCVVGIDRNWAYNPACKMAAP
ncbi:MAG TPA: hypothetical protein VNQ50_04285 [Xanthobacteraceae bacterium]|nr:hypothetical protein [Xanthobacteraceae bacterium]